MKRKKLNALTVAMAGILLVTVTNSVCQAEKVLCASKYWGKNCGTIHLADEEYYGGATADMGILWREGKCDEEMEVTVPDDSRIPSEKRKQIFDNPNCKRE